MYLLFVFMCYNINMKEYHTTNFNKITGYLTPGIYLMTIDELLSHKILGNGEQRKKLILSLKSACETYWSFGITEIYANGSFATMKPYPNDIDGYICVDFNSNEYKNLVNSGSVWGKFYGYNSEKDKFQMWYKYKIEFYLETENIYNNFFTHSRDGIERGIIKIIK